MSEPSLLSLSTFPVVLFSDSTTLRDVLLLFLSGFVALAGVAGRQLDVLLRGDTRLQLAPPLQLRIELRTEQQGEVRNPQPQQKDHDARKRSVRPVVVGEVADVEPERQRGQRQNHDRDERADADPSEL